jgi:hypothetical protein
MEREVGMNGHDIVGGILAVKAGVDTIKSLSGLFSPKKMPEAGLIPVYHLVPRSGTAKPIDQALGTRISKAVPVA